MSKKWMPKDGVKIKRDIIELKSTTTTKRVKRVKENPGKENCPVTANPLELLVPILVRALRLTCVARQGVAVLLQRATTLAVERVSSLGAKTMGPNVKGHMVILLLRAAAAGGHQLNVSWSLRVP